jgi:hypothetical protein
MKPPQIQKSEIKILISESNMQGNENFMKDMTQSTFGIIKCTM